MEVIQGFPYFPLEFTKDGRVFDPTQITALLVCLKTRHISDLLVISHGASNGRADATALYDALLRQLKQLLARNVVPDVAGRTFAVVGVLWPTRKITDTSFIPSGATGISSDVSTEQLVQTINNLHGVFDAPGADSALDKAKGLVSRLEDSPTAQDQFADLVRSVLPLTEKSVDDGSRRDFRDMSGRQVMEQFAKPIPVTAFPTARLTDLYNKGSMPGLSPVFGGVKAGALNLVNYTTYYQLKERADRVGRDGLHQVLEAVRQLPVPPRLHMVGHSFGGGVVTAAIAGPAGRSPLRVNSLVLLQAVISQYGFSDNTGFSDNYSANHAGYFRRVLTEHAVSGPILISHSLKDLTVGTVYPLVSMLSRQTAMSLGDANDRYGGMGRNGAQKTPEALNEQLLGVGGKYSFANGKIYNLNADSIIQEHSDIDHPEIAYALLTAIASERNLTSPSAKDEGAYANQAAPTAPTNPTGPTKFETRGEGPPREAAPSSAPTVYEERFLTARAQGKVKLREEFALIVSIISNSPAAGLGKAAVPIRMGAGTLDVDILAPAFEITEGSTRKLAVPATGDSAPVRFPMYAIEAGINTIELNAWNGPVHVAALKVNIAVEQLSQPERLALGGASSDMDTRSPEEGEYTLEVVFEADKNTYRFQLRSEQETLEPEYSPGLIAEQQRIITAVIRKLNGEARNINSFGSYQARIFLRNLGAELYDQLIPVNLQVALRKARPSIKRLNILSKPDPLPWEMMFISDPTLEGGGAFLAESVSISRWHYGMRAPKVLRRSPAYVIIPPGAPKHAMNELGWVSELSGKAELVNDLDKLLALTEAGGFSLLHFAAHNVSPQNVMDGFYIPFGDSRFDMTLLSGTIGASYTTNNTLVFMNACTSAGAAPMATEMAGWADRFLRRGAAAFVGSLWEVRDGSAAEFAREFYATLKAGKNLGEAMVAGRQTIATDDPTRLAYTLFGNPLATIY